MMIAHALVDRRVATLHHPLNEVVAPEMMGRLQVRAYELRQTSVNDGDASEYLTFDDARGGQAPRIARTRCVVHRQGMLDECAPIRALG